jgi:hypothetical protein
MDGLITIGLIVAAIAALDLAALRWGVDSRLGFDGREERTETRSL